MKIQLTLLTALLGLAAGKSPELNPKSFDEAIHSGKNVFVKFYAPVSDKMSTRCVFGDHFRVSDEKSCARQVNLFGSASRDISILIFLGHLNSAVSG